MKVNFIIPGLGDSGGIQVVKTYARLMAENGIDTIVYCPIVSDNLHRYKCTLVNRLHQIYCTVKTIKEKNEKKDVSWIPCVNDRFIRDADHTIATMWATAYNVANLSKKCGKKWYLIQGFEIWDNESLGLKSYQLPLNKIVISTWINEQLRENLGIGPFPVVYNGIDTNLFKPAIKNKRKYHLTILMLNHDNPVKGVTNGLKVLEEIKRVYPEIEFSSFGMRNKDNLPSWVKYYKDPDKKTLVKLYQESDIFIFPSLQDGWGLTPIEAMACGCAVVGTRTGFVLDLGRHMENMMISEPNDVTGMLNNAVELIENPELLKKIKAEAIKTINTLEWNNSTERLIELLLSRCSEE